MYPRNSTSCVIEFAAIVTAAIASTDPEKPTTATRRADPIIQSDVMAMVIRSMPRARPITKRRGWGTNPSDIAERLSTNRRMRMAAAMAVTAPIDST